MKKIIFPTIFASVTAFMDDSMMHNFTWSKTSPRFFHKDTSTPYDPLLNIALNDQLSINCPLTTDRNFYVYQVDKTAYDNCILPRRSEDRLRQQILHCNLADTHPALFSQRIIDQSIFGGELLILQPNNDYYFISTTRDTQAHECQRMKLHVLGHDELATITPGFVPFSIPEKSALNLLISDDIDPKIVIGIAIGASGVLFMVGLFGLMFCLFRRKQKPKTNVQYVDAPTYRGMAYPGYHPAFQTQTMIPPVNSVYEQNQGMRYLGTQHSMNNCRLTPRDIHPTLNFENDGNENMLYHDRTNGSNLLPVQNVGRHSKNRHSTSGSDSSSPTNNTNQSVNQPLLEQPGAVIDV